MVAILEKGEHNTDFHPMVDFLEASPLRYALTVKPTVYVSYLRQFWSTARIETTEGGTKILATVDGIVRTVSESSLRRNHKLRDEEGISSLPDGEGSGTPTEPHQTPSTEAQNPSHTTHPSSSLPPITTTSIPTVTPTETTPIRQYTRRTRIAQSSVPPTVADEPASPQRDVSQGEACPTDFDFIADRDRATIDKEGVGATNSGDDAPIKRMSMDEGEAATESVSDDTEEMATVLTSMNATTVLANGVVDVPTCSGSIPTTSTPAEGSVPIGSDEVPTASPVFSTATVVTPVTRRNGKEVMVESKTPKKQKVQEQIDAQEITEEAKYPEEVPKEKVKEMMNLVPIEEVYVEALQVKHPIIDWKVHSEGQRSYWKITRLGGNSAYYQFFIDLLKHLDREDLNQLWRLVKETLSNRPPSSDKELELWVELNRMYEPDKEDQLQRQRNLYAYGEGLPSEEGSSTCDDLLQTSSRELLTDGK
nr:hypothetical protein [Tanacetum cinerariifolium]